MRAIANNGTTHHYIYDASGERVIKSTGDGQAIYINGFPMGGSGTVGNYTMYVNPFIVVSNSKYTKHFYIEGQRIVSKLGDMGADHALLNPKSHAGDSLKNPVKWNDKKELSKAIIIANFEALGLSGAVFTAGKSGKLPYGQLKKYFRNTDVVINPDTTTGKKTENLQFYYHPDHLGSSNYITDASGEVHQHMEYFPFGETFIEERTDTEYTNYLYNGKELDEETGLYYYGARYYDPRVSMFYGVDPLAEKAPSISPYAYCFNNPIKLVDPDGQWPGVTTIFMQGNIGTGLGYGLYAVQQSGIAYDNYGKTHFTMTGTAYLVNQNLEDGSRNPNIVLGIDAGLSVGVSQDWSSKSFVESVGKSNQISVPGPTLKGSVGVGVSGNENSASLSVGLQAGVTFNTMGMTINESVSLTDAEASKVGKMTDVVTESWTVRNVSAVKDKGGSITGYSGNVFTKNTKGEYINTGVNVNSGVVSDDGKVSSNNMWASPAYQNKLNEDK